MSCGQSRTPARTVFIRNVGYNLKKSDIENLTEILRILSPVLFLGLVWSIIQFFLKRKYEKTDKSKGEKKEILTAYLLKLNELRGAVQETQMEIWKRTEIVRTKMKQYRSKYEPIFNYDKEFNPEAAFENFKGMTDPEKEKFLKKSVDLFESEKKIEETYKDKIKTSCDRIEKAGLELKKEALINLHSRKQLFDRQYHLIEKLDNFTIKRKSVEVGEEYGKGLIDILKLTQEILVECYNFEHLILVELKKL